MCHRLPHPLGRQMSSPPPLHPSSPPPASPPPLLAPLSPLSPIPLEPPRPWRFGGGGGGGGGGGVHRRLSALPSPPRLHARWSPSCSPSWQLSAPPASPRTPGCRPPARPLLAPYPSSSLLPPPSSPSSFSPWRGDGVPGQHDAAGLIAPSSFGGHAPPRPAGNHRCTGPSSKRKRPRGSPRHTNKPFGIFQCHHLSPNATKGCRGCLRHHSTRLAQAQHRVRLPF